MSLGFLSNNLTINSDLASLQKINQLLDHSTGSLSFWGSRLICHESGNVLFNELESKVMAAAKACLEIDVAAEKRILWIYISQNLTRIYQSIEKQLVNFDSVIQFFAAKNDPTKGQKKFVHKELFSAYSTVYLESLMINELCIGYPKKAPTELLGMHESLCILTIEEIAEVERNIHHV